jgi:hypothetical protein
LTDEDDEEDPAYGTLHCLVQDPTRDDKCPELHAEQLALIASEVGNFMPSEIPQESLDRWIEERRAPQETDVSA